MRKILKIFLINLLLITISISLSGCYDAKGIESYAYAIALGIDYINDNEIELTLQFAKPNSSSDEKSSNKSETSQAKDTSISSVKCHSIDSGLAIINTHISKKINLSHCQEIVFSEKLAKNGISNHLDTLINNIEIRTDSNILVCKGTAKNYISNVKPSLETLTARYYEYSLNSNQYTGYTVNTNIAEFYSSIKDTYSEAYCSLGGVNQELSNTEKDLKINGNYLASQTPIEDEDKVEILGIAVFKKDKLVGELTGFDSICHLLINNKLNECTLSIPNPKENGKYIDLKTTLDKKTKCKIIKNDNNPIIEINTNLIGYGLTLNNSINYSSQEDIKILKDTAQEYLKNQIYNYLYKTTKQYNSDISGFGKYAVSKYLTLQEWEKVNWLENYKNVEFKVNVNINIKSGSTFNKS